MSGLGHIPPFRSVDESFVKVREPAIELAFDRGRLGSPSRHFRRTIPQTLDRTVDAHETLHLLVRDARVALWVLGLHRVLAGWGDGGRRRGAGGVLAGRAHGPGQEGQR